MYFNILIKLWGTGRLLHIERLRTNSSVTFSVTPDAWGFDFAWRRFRGSVMVDEPEDQPLKGLQHDFEEDTFEFELEDTPERGG